MNKRIKQLLSWALVLCLLLSAAPVSGVAAEAENAQAAAPAVVEETPAVTQASGSAPALSEEVTVVREETSLRGEFEKHFLMSDGSYQAVVYSQPVHELVDGVWVEIETASQNARSDTTTDSTQQNIIDNYVLEGSGVQNSNLNRLYIGNKSGSTARAFIQFAVMPTIPQGAAITAATMTLTIYEGTSTANNASAYMVTGGEWTSSTISWDNMPAANTLLEDNISHNNLTMYQFSCLTAVQHWYDGDPTGQNENYGVMIRYYDETIADYNSVFSADYTVATQRPSLAFTYEPPTEEVFVSEGGTRRLTPPETTETLIWSSNNSAIATVDSTGLVTGIKAGKVTIYALVRGNIQKTYTVYVKVNDGVYRIDSTDNSVYLGTGSGALENAAVSLFAQNTSGLPMLRQLWRITYLGSGYYVIRPLHNMNMALHASAGTVNITTIGDKNELAAVPAENRWTIEFASNGYLLKCRGEDSQSLKCSANRPGASVNTSNYNATISSFKWAFDTAPTVANDLLLLDTQTGESAVGTTRYVALGETATLGDFGIGASFVCTVASDQIITWSSSSSSDVWVDSDTGSVTGLTEGAMVAIKAKHRHYGQEYEKAYTVCVTKTNVPVLRVRHYFDLGYNVREGNASTAIQSYNNIVAARFNSIFGIKLISTITTYTSVCDECVLDQSGAITSDSLETMCRHSVNCASTESMRNDLLSRYIPGDETSSVVIWSGRRMRNYVSDCSNSNEDTHSIVITTYGIPEWNSMNANYGDTVDTDAKYDDRTYSLMHELSHQLGARDHYCKGPDASGKCSNEVCDICVYGMEDIRMCIMGRILSPIMWTNETIYCNRCIAIISEHIADHHYPLAN